MSDQTDPERPRGAAADHIEQQWYRLDDLLGEALDILRSIHPRITHVLNESGRNHLARTLGQAETTHNYLQQAGPHVMGHAEYEAYLNDIAKKQMEITP